MEIHITKGIAMAIRAIFAIDPAIVEKQLNDTVSKAEEAFTTVKNTLKHFDIRLEQLERSASLLAEDNRRLISILQRWEDERREFQSDRPSENGLDDRSASE